VQPIKLYIEFYEFKKKDSTGSYQARLSTKLERFFALNDKSINISFDDQIKKNAQ